MMFRKVSLFRAALTCGLSLILAAAARASVLEVGIGESAATDAKAAGAEAAAAAKKALGDHQAKLVLVFHAGDLFPQSEALLEGVNSVFDAEKVYGCSGYATLTHHGADAQVAVLAIGGEVQVTAAAAATAGEDDDAECGKRLGKSLRRAAARDAKGRLVLLFGDCHVPRNNAVVGGLSSVLGPEVPVVGKAAFKGRSYVQGKIEQKKNVAILLCGDFRLGVSLKQDNSPEGLITSARDTLREAIGPSGENVELLFVFDCGGRRASMLEIGNFDKEIAVMQQIAGDSPFFGFFGSGEIGCKSTGDAPCGVGHHISACAVTVE